MSILEGVTMGMTERADSHDLAVDEADEEIHNKSRKLKFWLEPPKHM